MEENQDQFKKSIRPCENILIVKFVGMFRHMDTLGEVNSKITNDNQIKIGMANKPK